MIMGKVMMGKVGAVLEWVREEGRSFFGKAHKVTVSLASRMRCQVSL